MRFKIVAAVTALLASLPFTAFAETFVVDPGHTRIGFAVSHMVISEVNGDFKTFSGTVEISDGLLTGVAATIDAASLDTAEPKRDAHLNSADFFDTKKYPTITFHSTDVSHTGTNYTLIGDLTIKKVTKKVTLKGQFKGQIVDPWGMKRAGFHAEGKINRKEFGLKFNKLLEGGGLVVGDDVRLILDVEAIVPPTTQK